MIPTPKVPDGKESSSIRLLHHATTHNKLAVWALSFFAEPTTIHSLMMENSASFCKSSSKDTYPSSTSSSQGPIYGEELAQVRQVMADNDQTATESRQINGTSGWYPFTSMDVATLKGSDPDATECRASITCQGIINDENQAVESSAAVTISTAAKIGGSFTASSSSEDRSEISSLAGSAGFNSPSTVEGDLLNANSFGNDGHNEGAPPYQGQGANGGKCLKFSSTKVIIFVVILFLAVTAACVPVLVMPYLTTKASHTATEPFPPIPSVDSSASMATDIPSPVPSADPTDTPSQTTSSPSHVPSTQPTIAPTQKPTSSPSKGTNKPTIYTEPTISPSASPTSSPTFENATTIFYAIGDVPYNSREKVELAERIRAMPTDGDFLIHVGDIRLGQDPTVRCSLRDYVEVRRILLQSTIPVFIIPGGKLLASSL